MALHVFSDLAQGSAEWHTARRGIVTASTVGRLITPSTLKPAANPESRSLTALLAAERITGYTEPTYQSADMLRGVLCEPIARDVYSGHYQQAVECGFMRLDDLGWSLGFSPDGLVGEEGLLEIKSPRAKEHLRTILADEVPPQYVAQCQAGLLVSGREWLDFVSFYGGMPLFVKRVTPDHRWFDAIRRAVHEAECQISAAVYNYETRVVGLPTTERVDFDLEVVI